MAQGQSSGISVPQTSATDTDDLKTQQEMAAELKFLRSENSGLKAERDALKGQVTVLTRIDEVDRERGDFYKEAAVKGMKIDSNNGLITTNMQTEINVCKARNADLEKENAGLRSSRNWRTFVGFGTGFGAGVLTSHYTQRNPLTIVQP